MKFFLNRYSLFVLLFVVIQQLIVASSTLWIAKLGNAVVEGGQIYPWLVLFISSLVIVFLPGMGANFYLEKAKYCSFHEYVICFEKAFCGKASIRTDTSVRNEIQPYFNNEAWLVLDHSYTFFSDIITTATNVLFNVVVLGFVVDRKFMFAYLLSVPIFIILLSITKRKSEKLAIDTQIARTGLMQSLLPGWDTILINNKLNTDVWWREFTKKYYNSLRATLSSTFFVELVFNLSVVLAVSPVLIVIFLVIWQSRFQPEVLIVLVATLPRQVQIVQHISFVVMNAVRWHVTKAKIVGIVSILTRGDNKSLPKIMWDELSFEGVSKPINDLDSLLKQIESATAMRITIRGKNGSGKSSLLNHLKGVYGNKAFLLPTTSDLLFPTTVNKTFSSGEKIQASLRDLYQLEDISFFLLDEWDGNLDVGNTSIIDNEINKLAKKRCVIEVRHKV